MESKTSRYQSRILREMHQNTENPFNSPPSSTGSHGTVTLTSDISYDPQRMGDESLHFLSKNANKANRQNAYQINSAALDQDFIDFKDWKPASREQTTDIYNVTGEMDRRETKENHPPSSSTAASPTDQKLHDQNQKQFNIGAVSQKARSQMQARVDNESDGDSTQMSGSSRLNGQRPRRANVTSLIQSLKAAQAAKEAKSTPQKETTPRSTSAQHATPRQIHPSIERIQLGSNRQSRGNNMHMSPEANQTARSFFLPNLAHIDDFISGALKIQSVDNGMPVFVKHGKVHDRELKSSPKHHAEIEMIGLPEDEQQIFVSLDKIRDEIQALQAHDDQVSRQAELFQEEVYELQLQLSKIRGRKDSAMGSDSDNSLIIHMNSRQSELEDKVATLQAKLDKANRKISINEIHTETYISERDEALKSATSQLERVHRLESELETARKGLSGSTSSQRSQNAHGAEAEHRSLLEENHSLRSHNTIVTQQNQDLQQEVKRLQRLVDVLQGDNQVLQSEYKVIVEEKQTLRQDNLSLERQNDKFFHDTKSLQQKNSLLERRVGDLHDDNAKLHQMVESANAETGTMTFDVKDMRDRLEKKNRELADENAQLQQQVVNLQSDYASKRLQFEQEKRRLDEEQDYLHDQVNRISKRFERVVQDSEEKDAEYEERQASLTQQLQDIANREAALAARLRESAGQESTLQREVQRRTEAIAEAQRIAREVQNLKTSSKPVKITRIVEPTTSRIRSTTSDMSLRNTLSQDLQMEDDYTQQLDLTHGSDFGDTFAKADMNRLQNALRQNQSSQQQRRDFTEEYLDDVDAGFTEDMSQSLPPAFMPERNASPTKTKAANAKGQPAQSKRQPSGILKNTQHARRVSEQDTGRFSVRSGMSGLSLPDHTTESNVVPHARRHSDSEQFEMDVEENMTSALFMDDITLDARKRRAEKEAATRDLTKESTRRSMPSLSKEAKRVLDGLCHDHDCSNCIVCTRIKAHASGTTKKTTVRVEQPVPVTDRVANPEPVEGTAFEDQPTMRPSRDPAIALAVVIKNIKDELTHIKSKLMAKQTELNELDPSFGRRHRQQLNAEISQLSRLSEMKCEQLYQLYDVVEGQKMSGQQMSQEELEITIMSIQCKDDTWNGITD